MIYDPDECYSATIFNCGLAYIADGDGKYIDENGNVVLEVDSYGGTCFYDDGYAIIMSKDLSTELIDINGNVIKRGINSYGNYFGIYNAEYWNYHYASSP